MQKMIKKHFFNQEKTQFDLVFITKLVRVIEQFESIFGSKGNLGRKYERLRLNLWANQYLREVKGKLMDESVQFEMNYEKNNKLLVNFQQLFNDDMLKKRFYEEAKDFVRLDESCLESDQLAQFQYYYNCIRQMEAPLPTFAKLIGHCLLLVECRISDAISLAMAEYLRVTKSIPEKHIKQLIIDDCGMSDQQYAHILEGIHSQGNHIKQLVYSNNDLSYKSMEVLDLLIPCLREINFNNLTRGYGKPMYNKLIESCHQRGVQLQKLKLSNVNLNDNQIVQNLCDLLANRPFIMNLDLSWTRLQSKHLNQIIMVLDEKSEHSMRNLNLSYNCLLQPPKDEGAYYDENDINYESTEEFAETLWEYITKNEVLNHLDISGMNFSDEQLIQISKAASQSEGLIAIHMSDNGIRAEKELQGEVLDIFGLSEDIFKDR